jgi:mono/diheme cytochrome c family protein
MTKLVDSCTLAFVAMALSTSAFAQPKVDLGKKEFDANCAICHGADAKGSGAYGELLRRSPANLTLLAKQNQGVFPLARLYEVVEGSAVPAHGTRDMPIWGREFRAQDFQYYLEARGHYDSAALVRARILLLLEYINRLQAP